MTPLPGAAATSPPTGTVTFLFTDVEGSTRLWEAHAAAMRAALARHDALLRDSIGSHDGHIFKTGGDAFCAAFHTAPDALAAALEAQRALGRQAEANAALRALETGFGWTAAYQIAEAYAERNDVDKAFEWLEKAYVQRDPGVVYTAMDGLLAPLHGDPRWRSFVRKLGFVD